MKRHTLRAVALALSTLAGLPAHALVESGHWRISTDDSGSYTPIGVQFVSIWVDQTPDGDFTGSFLDHDPTANTLTYLTNNVDEGSQIFLVQSGEVFTAASIATMPASAAMMTPTQVGEDFYLGVRTGSQSDPGFVWGPEGYTTFGWAHFREGSDGKLYIVDSAMAFREGGIVVGTMQAVPEPATWASLIAGLAALGGIARQQRRVTA